MSHTRVMVSLLLACALALSAACGKRAQTADAGADAQAASGDQVVLPKPAATGGSVTGMPSRPGPNPVGQAMVPAADASVAIAEAASIDNATPATGDDIAIATDAATGTAAGSNAASTSPSPAEPSLQDAVAVIIDYYAAIQRHDFAHAWSLWSDGGRSSGQTLQQFADGFASTEAVSVQPGAPGRMDAAAGSRYVEIPVAVTATQHDGTTHRYTGSYTLRRAMVDGASAEQRAWRIGSANLHERQP